MKFLVPLMFFIVTGLNGQVVNKFVPITATQYGTGLTKKPILITPVSPNGGDYPANVCILDSAGNDLFRIIYEGGNTGPVYPGVFASDLKVNPNHTLTYTYRLSNVSYYVTLDTNMVPIDTFSCSGWDTDAHDFIVLPNGNYFMLCYETRPADLTSLTTTSGFVGSPFGYILGNVIQEFDSSGALLSEWKSIDHYTINDTYDYFFTDPMELDHAHINSVEIDSDTNYIISSRHLNEVCKINRNTGDFMWRLGGKNNEFSFIGDTVPFIAQHDARIAQGNFLSLYDNSSEDVYEQARGLMYQLDTTLMTATLIRKQDLSPAGKSAFIGSTRFYDNGNVFINWGGTMPLGQRPPGQEFDSSGNLLLDINVPLGWISYRIFKQDLNFTFERPEIQCDSLTQTLSVTGFNSYHWNTGDQGSSLFIQNPGTYQVWVDYGIGYLCSEPYYVTDVNNVCLTNSIAELQRGWLKVYPNPVVDYLMVDIENKNLFGTNLNVYDMTGKLVFSENISNETFKIDFTSLSSGVYLIVTNDLTYKVTKQ